MPRFIQKLQCHDALEPRLNKVNVWVRVGVGCGFSRAKPAPVNLTRWRKSEAAVEVEGVTRAWMPDFGSNFAGVGGVGADKIFTLSLSSEADDSRRRFGGKKKVVGN